MHRSSQALPTRSRVVYIPNVFDHFFFSRGRLVSFPRRCLCPFSRCLSRLFIFPRSLVCTLLRSLDLYTRERFCADVCVFLVRKCARVYTNTLLRRSSAFALSHSFIILPPSVPPLSETIAFLNSQGCRCVSSLSGIAMQFSRQHSSKQCSMPLFIFFS